MLTGARPRLEAIDFARGAALAAMAVYHFTWDLEFFGYVPAGMTAVGGWRLFARAIASSFLFLVGVSLFLAHAEGVRWRKWLKRMAMVAAAAAAISLATLFATPGGFIFFGILHHIALASLVGLAFLRLPALVTLAAAVAALAAPAWLRSPFFDHPALWWVGLSAQVPRSNDYVPLLPWIAAVLAGVAAAQAARATGLFERLKPLRLPHWTRPVQAAGRHSLAVYLLHQPLLIGGVFLFSLVLPPAEIPQQESFMRACTAQCREMRDERFCESYCTCMLDRLAEDDGFDAVYDGAPTPEAQQRLLEAVSACTVEAEFSDTREDEP